MSAESAKEIIRDEIGTTKGWWDTSHGRIVALAILLLVSVVILFGNLSRVGIWEPWEANEILVAREYSERGPAQPTEELTEPSYNWAVPTLDGKPVERPLLKTWLLSLSTSIEQGETLQVGDIEFNARFPMATLLFFFVFVAFFWTRHYLGTWPALMSSAVFVTCPAIFIGAHNVASEMVFVVTSSLAVMAFAQMVLSERHRWLWGVVFGVALAASFLDQRLLGLYLPLTVAAGFAVTELALRTVAGPRSGEAPKKWLGPFEVGGAISGVVAAAGAVLWGLSRSADAAGDAVFLPHVVQWIFVLVPLFLFAAAFSLARKSDAGRAIFGIPGILAALIVIPVVAAVAVAYSDANPVLLRQGDVVGKLPVLTYLLENHLFETSLAKGHLTFDIWLRQIGFLMLPWVALLPAGLAYLGRATGITVEDEEDEEETLRDGLMSPGLAFKRLLLVWAFFAAVVLAVFSAFGHYFYPAYFPLAASVGLMMADARFWESLRSRRPLVMYAIGFVGIAILLVIGKDLQRFPVRFIEIFLTLEKDFKLPEDFSYGTSYRALKYAWMSILAVFFFGLVSWAILTFRTLRELPGTIGDWLERRREGIAEEDGSMASPPSEAPYIRRAREKAAIHEEKSSPARVARLFEQPSTFGLLLLAVFSISAGVFLYVYVPNLTDHLSQRGVFAIYQQLSDEGEKLYRYQVSTSDTSVYLQDVEAIQGYPEFARMFDSDERFFAVIPRGRLPAINYEIRKRYGKNLAVLDARSSRLLLVSNQLEEGEENKNFVADKIVEGEPEVEFPVQFANEEGELVHPTFDGKLKMLGYSVDTEERENGLPVYEWGETARITYFFEVLQRVPSSYQIFLHVDYPGNRINGDHYPNEGEFPTNYWLPGDIVKDVHPLHIESYSTPGAYSMWFGFFLGSKRMKVEPDNAHDGGNRVMIGKIKVKP